MRKTRELLLKFRFDSRFAFSLVEVCYVDRRSPGDRSCVDGSNILMLDPYFMKIGSGNGTRYIPYHRIRKILYDGTVVWER
jgi:uncharacterized protein (UPF0248 family)